MMLQVINIFFAAASYSQVLPPNVIWEYYCDHLDLMRLEEWISAQYPLSPASTSPSPWPYNQPITDEMLLITERCPSFIKDHLLDLLAR
jgi:hypothetical protein